MRCSYFRASSAGSMRTLACASFRTRIMRAANLSVDTVSSRWAASPQIHANMSVRQFPPRESFRTLVSLDCRNGTCCLDGDVRATTHCSRNVRERLMYMDSRLVVGSRDPCPAGPSSPAMVFFRRSLPARSTRCSLENSVFSPPPSLERCSMCTVNTQCDRLLCLFSRCSAVVRAISPRNSWFSASSSVATATSVRPFTTVPRKPLGSSAMANSPPSTPRGPASSSWSRSKMRSL
mmetsp:Transcript_22896/g.73727  ORF Transcript_22896/g.73727 Transcript_22896/m.73727 type:complete len:235 (-) Transcript_22896:417-1121(-)